MDELDHAPGWSYIAVVARRRREPSGRGVESGRSVARRPSHQHRPPSGHARKRGPLDQDTRQTAEARPESEAVVHARDRIALVVKNHGARHPEYATALNQLALLLIMQGEPESAEPLLRQALDVRRDILGVQHPDFATNLSSLGGLLWARGDLDGAEPLLRQSAEIRRAALGPEHPKSVASLNSLNQLLKVRREAVAHAGPANGTTPETPQPEPTSAPEPVIRLGAVVRPEHFVKPGTPFLSAPLPLPVAAQPAVEEQPTGADAAAVAARLGDVRAAFGELAGRFEVLGRGLKDGRPPDGDAARQARGAVDLFERLRREAAAAAAGLGLGTSVSDVGPANLDEVDQLLPALHTAEETRSRSDRTRRTAFDVLDRIDRLTCPTDPGFAPLASCHELSRSIRTAIESAGPDDAHDDVRRLAEGDHPLAALLGIVRADESTPDATWAGWYEAVESGLGRPLAVAVARGKLVERAG